MRNFGASYGFWDPVIGSGPVKGAKYIENNKRYVRVFLPALESKFRSAGFSNYADSVKTYMAKLVLTGDEQASRNAAKTSMFTPPSKAEYLGKYQQYKEAFLNEDTAMDWTVRHFVNKMRPGVDVSELPAFQSGGTYDPGKSREIQSGFQMPAKMKLPFGPAGSGRQTVSADESMYEDEDQSFFQQYKMPIIGALVLVSAGGAYYLYKRM